MDLLSPQDGDSASYVSDWETFKDSEIIQTLKREDKLLKYFVILAIHRGILSLMTAKNLLVLIIENRKKEQTRW